MKLLKKINQMSQEKFNTMMNVIVLTILAGVFFSSIPSALDNMLNQLLK